MELAPQKKKVVIQWLPAFCCTVSDKGVPFLISVTEAALYSGGRPYHLLGSSQQSVHFGAGLIPVFLLTILVPLFGVGVRPLFCGK